ncbi:MAG: oxygen-independent coproporphyrinogen III oxidase [Candidatus Eremiobacteraeota bacterium]|nr:oxygen-independent coproporphyrinogen III oxidase [Candidatus Eremiobacteraeota bacterium]
MTDSQNTPIDAYGLPLESAWPRLILTYDRALPRYTSYPTVPNWKDDPEAARARVLGAARDAGEVALYVHVPFCPSLCYYCACNRYITRDANLVDRYLDAVERELDAVAITCGLLRITALHWGGGTPNSLDPSQTRRLFESVIDRFELSGDAEISIEVDPRLATQPLIALLGQLGFNRLSAGVQDFNERTQAAIHRVQSLEQTKATIEWARASGIRGINVDLIYGLPHQSRATFARTLEQVSSLAPDTIAMYAYAHVPWVNSAQRIYERELPAQLEKFGMLVDANHFFADSGYEAIGIDHFAAPASELAAAGRTGRLQRTFMGYTPVRADTLIGIGASAISASPAAFSQNTSGVVEYIDAPAGPISKRGCNLCDDDITRARIIGAIMTRGSADFSELGEEKAAYERLRPMAADGLVRISSARLTLTPLGRLFARNVAACFDAYASDTSKHAAAV